MSGSDVFPEVGSEDGDILGVLAALRRLDQSGDRWMARWPASIQFREIDALKLSRNFPPSHSHRPEFVSVLLARTLHA